MRRPARNTVLHLAAGALIAAACTFAVAAEAAQPLLVYMNHARILKLSRPVEKVIVGNSNIADVTVADPKTIVLTGKAFGTTNLVLLDKNGGAILDKDVLVGIDEDHTVRVYRQTERSVLSCGPNCVVQADAASKAP